MKRKINIAQFLSFLIAGTLLFSGCKSNLTEPDTTVKDQYLVSYSLVRSMTATEVTKLFSPAQSIYPDVADILPAVKTGAKVYTVTYYTSLGAKKLVASGLVCIPEGGGT